MGGGGGGHWAGGEGGRMGSSQLGCPVDAAVLTVNSSLFGSCQCHTVPHSCHLFSKTHIPFMRALTSSNCLADSHWLSLALTSSRHLSLGLTDSHWL